MTKPTDLKSQFVENIVQNTNLSLNIGQNIITTTEDKVRLSVYTHLKSLEHRTGWVTPASLLLSIIATFVTTDFQKAWLAAETWEAVFFLCGIGSLCWLVVGVVRALRASSVDDFVKSLREAQHVVEGGG